MHPPPIALLFLSILLFSPVLRAQQSPGPQREAPIDAKNLILETPSPPADPDLERYAIYGDTAPLPPRTEPVATTLPLALKQGDRVVFIGNTLLERENDFGYFEALLQQAHPGLELAVRNLAWSADEVDLQPRPDNFGTLAQHLTAQKADVIFAAFGFNESFAGLEALPSFKARLTTFLIDLKTSAFNGQSGPRIVLISPTANEDVAAVAAASFNNERLAAYTAVIAEVAAAQQVAFADVFEPTARAMADPATDLTFNGVHLVEAGYRVLSDALFRRTFAQEVAPNINERLRAVILDKNRQFFRRYRPVNTFYYTGGRNKEYGYLDFLPAMRNFDLMVANRDRRIWDLAQGKSVPEEIDDSSLPPLPPARLARGANEWLSPADELAAFHIDPRFEVNLFASEEEFPDLACPIQMRWDAQGRLWVACSTTYPHVYPGQEPVDKIVILEDTDGDGKADTCRVWADDLHIPLSFEFGDGGVYVSEEPHLTFLQDTNGDGRADFRRKMLAGFGTEDSHHALHDFVWTPDGDLLFRESIFHHSQVETPYGPVRAKNSAWFSFQPRTHRLLSFGSYQSTNPWGVTFDDWGRHVASHPVFASAFHALNPPYPEQHPKPAGIPAYSGTAGHEFVDFPMWPEEMQGGFVKVRYKPTNRVEIHRWIEQDDGFEEKYEGDLIFSTNLSFIPVDIRFGPRGALYVCDWYNPIKGHAQYSLRDERRDRESGRIWRILPQGAQLQDPPAIDGQPLPALLDILQRPEYRYRYWAKREIREHDAAAVKAALDAWVAALDPAGPRFRHHQVEALWTYRSVGAANPALLTELLTCENHHARAAAAQQLRHASLPIDLLRARAEDESGLVRLEAVIAASYIGTPEALEAVLPVLSRPMGPHLAYAARTSFGSANLGRHWKGDANFLASHPALASFMKESREKKSKIDEALSTRSPREAQFDGQPGLQEITIRCVPERMLFDISRIETKARQPIKLNFINPDATPHNWVLVQPGALEEVGLAGNEMAKDPSGITKGFLPDSPKIIQHSRMLDPDSAQVLRFRAPAKPGTYPFLCTFPGHWIVMKGELVVQ